jgi:hypothetical protein
MKNGKRGRRSYAIFWLAGKAAQVEYAGGASEEDAKADYFFIAHRLSNCQRRIGELEQAARALAREYWPTVQAVAARASHSIDLIYCGGRGDLQAGHNEEVLEK